jgi:hypothetical protein
MSRTPYEIRFDLLSMANGILMDAKMLEQNEKENKWSLEKELFLIKIHNNSVFGAEPPRPPKMEPIEEKDIIALAERLNDFVSNDSK